MNLGLVMVVNAAVIAAFMAAWWRLSLRLRRVDIVDVAWGLGFVVVAWVTWAITDGTPIRKAFLVAMATGWGLRLSAHLAWRMRDQPEDRRYVAMRRRVGDDRFPRVSLTSVFLLQGALMWVVSLPLQVGQVPARPEALTLAGAFGVALWTVGMFFETVGDWQLARFRARPENAGRVLDRGLWRYTRHPNYFGDFCVWWGIFMVAATTPPGIASAPGPLLMSALLLRVSGVPLLERSMSERRPEYAAYAARTNAFLPGPPRDEAGRWP